MAIYESFPTTIEGTVQQFKFVNPHSIIVLKGSAANDHPVVWFLEGDAPAILDRQAAAASQLALAASQAKREVDSGRLWRRRALPATRVTPST
jgi:Family of unknown function (DUF6152)